jgi:integrase
LSFTARGIRKFANLQEADIARGQYRDRKAGEVTVAEFWPEYWDIGRPDSLLTQDLYKYMFRDYVKPKWSRTKLSGIRSVAVEAWLNALREKHGARTVEQAHSLLRRILTVAVEDGRLPSNPAKLNRTLRRQVAYTPKRVPRALIPEELMRVVSFMPERYRALPIAAFAGALRFGEVTALRVKDLDFDANTITVREAVKRIDGKIVVGPTKTPGSAATVKVMPSLLAMILDHVDEFCDGPNSMVFTTATGKPTRQKQHGEGLQEGSCPGEAGASLFRLFMTFAVAESRGRPASLTPKELQGFARHRDIRTTLAIYTAVHVEMETETQSRMDKAWHEAVGRRLRAVT